MSLSIDEVIDGTFGLFGKIENAADLGTKQIGLDNGTFPVKLDSLFIPTASENQGYMVSRAIPLQKPRIGQPERSITYTNISGLNNISTPDDVSRLFQVHLIPPRGEKVGIIKVYGTLVHYKYQTQSPEEITEHQVQKAKYNIEAPLGIIVVSGMNLDPRFNQLQILKESRYDIQAPIKFFGRVLDELKAMPTYRL